MEVTDYYDDDAGATIYHVVPGPESVETDSTLQSETDSSASAFTVSADEIPDYFIQHHGRQQPAGDNVIRWFPADNVKRYMLLHWVARWIFGGDYTGPIREIITPVPGGKRCVLELGTRAGTWAQAMAAEFPHVQFRSLDLVPMISHIPRSNITFEAYDFTKGILLEDSSQDAVFLNFVIEMVRDYRVVLREVYRVLRPGGLIHIRDFCPGFWGPRDISIRAGRTNPVSCHLFELIIAQLTKAGIDPDTCEKIPGWLGKGSVLWEGKDEEMGFEAINSTMKAFPVFPHEGFPCMPTNPGIIPFLMHMSLMSMRDMSSLLRDGGMAAAEAENLVDRAIEEIRKPACCAYIKAYSICGVKRIGV